MSKIVDARGFSCPQPVMMAKQAISENVFPVEVLVDTVTSRENVKRMAKKMGCQVNIEAQEDEFKLILTK